LDNIIIGEMSDGIFPMLPFYLDLKSCIKLPSLINSREKRSGGHCSCPPQINTFPVLSLLAVL